MIKDQKSSIVDFQTPPLWCCPTTPSPSAGPKERRGHGHALRREQKPWAIQGTPPTMTVPSAPVLSSLAPYAHRLRSSLSHCVCIRPGRYSGPSGWTTVSYNNNDASSLLRCSQPIPLGLMVPALVTRNLFLYYRRGTAATADSPFPLPGSGRSSRWPTPSAYAPVRSSRGPRR